MTTSTSPRTAGNLRATGRRVGRAFRLALLSTAPVVALAAHAYAADAAGAPPPDAASAGSAAVQDVVVTATRQSTNLQKTAVAVTVVGADKIATQNLITVRVTPRARRRKTPTNS